MSESTLKQDIDAMYALAERTASLSQLLPSLCDVIRKHPAELADVTYSYRLRSTDTGCDVAFRLTDGVYGDLDGAADVDVIVSGTEKNLLAIFQRKLNPVMAMMLGKVKISGSKAALIKMAEFL